jgi:hypothetical protein
MKDLTGRLGFLALSRRFCDDRRVKRLATWYAALVLLAAPHTVSLHASKAVDVSPLQEAVRWMRDARDETATYHYTMTANLRILFFWIGKSDVGGGYIRLARGIRDPHLEAVQVVFGSDPAKAPRRINRWGAATEVVRYRDTRGKEIESSAFWGFMKESKGDTVSEMDAELSDEEMKKQHLFKANLSRVDPDRALATVVPYFTDQDLDLHQLENAEAAALQRIDKGESTARVLDESALERCGRRQGFLFTMKELIESSLSQPEPLPSMCYIFNAKVYTATLIDIEPVAVKSVELDLNGEEEKVRTEYRDLLSARFLVVDQASSKKVKYTVLIGTTGRLRGVPVRIQYQPKWWFRVTLDLLPPSL